MAFTNEGEQKMNVFVQFILTDGRESQVSPFACGPSFNNSVLGGKPATLAEMRSSYRFSSVLQCVLRDLSALCMVELSLAVDRLGCPFCCSCTTWGDFVILGAAHCNESGPKGVGDEMLRRRRAHSPFPVTGLLPLSLLGANWRWGSSLLTNRAIHPFTRQRPPLSLPHPPPLSPGASSPARRCNLTAS